MFKKLEMKVKQGDGSVHVCVCVSKSFFIPGDEGALVVSVLFSHRDKPHVQSR